MKFINLLSYFIAVIQLIGCSTQLLNNKIEIDSNDLLKEESLMRYNSNRLQALENSKSDTISSAILACHQNKFTKGLGLLEKEMHQNKTNAFYWNALGTCYSLNQDYSKALFYYQLGIEALASMSSPNKAIAEASISNNVGLIHLNFKRFDEAFNLFKKANTLAPEFVTPEYNMAQLYLEFNQNNKALIIFKKLEKKNPNDIDLLYSLSLVYFRINDLDNSFKSISKIQPNYLNRPDIVGLYAYNLMKKNRLEEAKTILEKRLYADGFDHRNKVILEEINQKIKEQVKTVTK